MQSLVQIAIGGGGRGTHARASRSPGAVGAVGAVCVLAQGPPSSKRESEV